MPMRPCLGHRGQPCGKLTAHASSRCDEHRRAYEAARRPDRPTARQRGYDSAHEARRKALLPGAYGQPCPRCHLPMLPGQDLYFGHTVARSVDPSSRADHFEHRHCNESAGAASIDA